MRTVYATVPKTKDWPSREIVVLLKRGVAMGTVPDDEIKERHTTLPSSTRPLSE